MVQGIESELDRGIRGEDAIWFDAKKAGLAHRINTPYGFLTLLGFVEDPPTKNQAENGFLYRMASIRG